MNIASSSTDGFNPDSSAVIFRDGSAFSIPGSRGQIREISAKTASTRSLGTAPDQIDPVEEALQDAEMKTISQYEINLQDQQVGVRSLEAEMTTGGSALPIHYQMPGEVEKDYALITYDEESGYQWVFPTEMGTVSRSMHKVLNFEISRPLGSDMQSRSLIYKAARKIVRLIAWKSQDFIGRKALKYITDWENKKRPYGLHKVNLNKDHGFVEPITDWDHLGQGKVLLLIHGTFGTTKSSFGEMISSRGFNELAQLYQGRVIAFNHPTLHHTPPENVSMLHQYLGSASLSMDIMTSSRGGLVGREFVHQTQVEGFHQQVERVLMVAAPNRGTVLADPEKMLDLIDRLTNMLTYLPVNVFMTIFESILALVKILGSGAVAGLPGLQAQAPNSEYLKRLNKIDLGRTEFFSISADFAPDDAGWLKRMGKKALDEMIDRVFGEANDGVVPTDGAYDTRPLVISNAATRGLLQEGFFYIPVSNRRIFRNNQHMHHLNYFSYPEVQKQILHCLRHRI